MQQPRWALPHWYRWLEDNYKGIVPLLQREVKQDKMWHKRTATQKDLERWAAEVWHKRWLQSHYDGETVTFMLAEARMDDHWLERVATQEGLVQWAREMAAQYPKHRKG